MLGASPRSVGSLGTTMMPKLAALEVFGVLLEVGLQDSEMVMCQRLSLEGGHPHRHRLRMPRRVALWEWQACKPPCKTKGRTCRAGCCPDDGVPLVAPHVMPARVVMLGWAWRKVDADTADHGGGREGRSDAASAAGHLESAKDSGWCWTGR